MALEYDELASWLRLQLTDGIGNSTARALLRTFGLPSEVFSQSLETLCDMVTPTQANALLREPAGLAQAMRTTWDWLQAAPEQRRVLTLGDSAYPQALLEIDDPAPLIYGMGHSAVWEPGALDSLQCVAVVGSRNPTPQGLANAKEFGQALAQAGLTVVSGMALGVDGAAHQGALEAFFGPGAAVPRGGVLPTIAVVGTGLDRVYPKQHLALAQKIAAHGLLLSEYPLGTPPLAAHFPQRNRLISGLARGTLVVEAALQSGSLITARLALEQGRDVFAIPGSIHSPQSRGCHALIKQGAKLVDCAQDVLEEIAPDSATAWCADTVARPARTVAFLDLTQDQAVVVEALGFEPCSLEALQARTGWATPRLQAELMALELQNEVLRLAGGKFQRRS